MSGTSPFPGIGTIALGHLGHTRNASSHRCKFSAIYDWLDNHTSPHVGAKIVDIEMTSRRSPRGGSKVGVSQVHAAALFVADLTWYSSNGRVPT